MLRSQHRRAIPEALKFAYAAKSLKKHMIQKLEAAATNISGGIRALGAKELDLNLDEELGVASERE